MIVLNARFPLVRLYVVTHAGTEIPQSDPIYRAILAQVSQQ